MSPSPNSIRPPPRNIQSLPPELQVRTLSYLRAVDLSSVHQVNRFFWRNTTLQHQIVVYCAASVYPPRWTQGFELQPVSSSSTTVATSLPPLVETTEEEDKKPAGTTEEEEEDKKPAATPPTPHYTFEHLRNMELLVVARVLNSPEPTTGYVVSKSWCKAALCWLEDRATPTTTSPTRNNNSNSKRARKKKKKQQQQQQHPPPSDNINSDILCVHMQLQHVSSNRSARARRRLLDKQAWKTLKTLYPQSTALSAEECWQCRLEAAQAKKSQADTAAQAAAARKQPLQNPIVRRFYTRTRGVPEHCVVVGSYNACPLADGVYYVLPRSWCHGWRRYMKTGEGPPPSAPDASRLLCHLHSDLLLPPHLEAYWNGESDQLFSDSTQQRRSTTTAATVNNETGHDSVQVLRGLGWNDMEIAQQLQAMRSLERPQQQQHVDDTRHQHLSRNERLDRENHVVVEILTEEEFRALERPGSFGLQFVVHQGTVQLHNTPVCRACDATGRQCSLTVRNRARNKKNTGRSSGTLEY